MGVCFAYVGVDQKVVYIGRPLGKTAKNMFSHEMDKLPMVRNIEQPPCFSAIQTPAFNSFHACWKNFNS